MNTSVSKSRRRRYYTVRQVAWLVGVEPQHVSRAIRIGTLRAERQPSGLVVSADQIARLLTENHPPLGVPHDG